MKNFYNDFVVFIFFEMRLKFICGPGLGWKSPILNSFNFLEG